MKKTVSLLLSLTMLLLLAACGGSGGDESTTTATPETTEPAPTESAQVQTFSTKEDEDTIVVAVPSMETEAPTDPLSAEGSLRDGNVSIGDFELIETRDGEPAVLVHFSFTNTTDENQAAMYSLYYSAFQNGIGLEDAFITDDNIHNSEMLTKKIQPGTTIELTDVFLLADETAPIEFYVMDSFAVNSNMIGKVYELDPDTDTILSTAPGVENASKLGTSLVSINSYKLVEDYQGAPAIALTIGYTNNGNIWSPFYTAVDVTAFQDGIELSSASFIDDSVVDNDGCYVCVLPGAGHAVMTGFVLANETSPVVIEISDTFSLDNTKITTEIPITE